MTQQKKAPASAAAQSCAACGKPITGKTFKGMGNLYCSLYCAELVSERLNNLDMSQVNFEELGPVVDRFMSTCQVCPLPAEMPRRPSHVRGIFRGAA